MRFQAIVRSLVYVLRLGSRVPGGDLWRWRKLGARIGERVYVEDVSIEEGFAQLLAIEDDVVIAARTRILLHDSSLNNLVGLPIKFGRVTIRKGAYIGSNCTILCGVEIGEGALIGAGSVVTRDVPSGMVAYGVPAKPRSTVTDLVKKFTEEMAGSQRYDYLDVPSWRERARPSAKEQYRASLVQFLETVGRR